MWRRTAGIWGPAAFGAASVVAARRQPGYSHVGNHISGLAAAGERSAEVMVPGFVALGASQLVLPAPSSRLRSMLRVAGVTSILAGVVRVSDPRCPQPGDPEATASDLGHGAASVATFVLWAAMPVIAARDDDLPGRYRRLARTLVAPIAVLFVAAGVTTRLDSSVRGVAQRAFLAAVATFLAATGLQSRTG